MGEDLTVVFGAGAVGGPIARALLARGQRVRVAQRTQGAGLPEGAEFMATDILDAAAVARAAAGARQVVLSVGFAYDSRLWRRVWPATMANVLAACEAAGARLVFIDNLYQLGPQAAPRTEAMPLSDRGDKPAILSQVTRQWQAAAGRGLKVAALRCPDFYGPGVDVSHIGATGFGRVAAGQPAMLIAPPDTPHDFAYVPDIVRAALALLDTGDDAYGQAWNVPCAPTLTPRQILALGARAIGARLRVAAIPLWTLPVLGLAVRFLREVNDVRFTFDRPYVVDSGKFQRRFGLAPTPYAEGAAATARAYATAAG
ncbi:NAD-dependent epimerase/dehydratase family protein [Caulobacter sp. KR2-114]|uniref:NAD-dependent epimerase/dehydratase family protein n=1 Tax=Caulobacter sp. KR2-114 TaxID=3400912 RepID=UPI003BFD1002